MLAVLAGLPGAAVIGARAARNLAEVDVVGGLAGAARHAVRPAGVRVISWPRSRKRAIPLEMRDGCAVALSLVVAMGSFPLVRPGGVGSTARALLCPCQKHSLLPTPCIYFAGIFL